MFVIEEMLVYGILFFLINKYWMPVNIEAIIYVTLLFLLLGVLDIALNYSYENKTIYALSKKGNKLHKDLMGLKMYLKDYSMMSSKSINELELWDEYMIYSIILNDNKKVQNEILKIIEEQFR